MGHIPAPEYFSLFLGSFSLSQHNTQGHVALLAAQ